MEIKHGATVMGTSGKLGEVTRVIYDTHTRTMDQLVVRHGTILGNEHVVPFRNIARAEGDTVHVNLDKDAFEALEKYAPYPDRPADTGSSIFPGADDRMINAANFGMGTGGAVIASPDPTADVPREGHAVPDDRQMPVVEKGMHVYDVDGHKLGEISDFTIDTESEKLTRLRVHHGLLPGQDSDIAVTSIKEIAVKGILLNKTKAELEDTRKDH